MLLPVTATTFSCGASVFRYTFKKREERTGTIGKRAFPLKHETLSTDCTSTHFNAELAQSRLVVTNTKPYAPSRTLRRGAQRELMAAARFSAKERKGINTLTTINTAQLQRIGAPGIFQTGHLWSATKDFIEKFRKWTVARGLPWVAVWVREVAGKNAQQPGEHLHLGSYLPRCRYEELVQQVPLWTGEGWDQNRPLDDHKGEVAFSEGNAWNITTRIRGRGGPQGIAAYLGKAEPNRIPRYGKLRDNPDKADRRQYGGEGLIEGKRYGVSRAIDQKAQREAGFQPVSAILRGSTAD